MPTVNYTYTPVPSSLEFAADTFEYVKKFGGFNPETRSFTPLNLAEAYVGCGSGENYIAGCNVFDTITAAIEAGIIDYENWPKQLFANKESFDNFVSCLYSYTECYHFHDNWWGAFFALFNSYQMEEGYATASDLAQRFSEAVEELNVEW